MNSALTAVLLAVEHSTDITRDEILGRKRHKRIARARNLVMFLLRFSRHYSYPYIGHLLKRDHRTVQQNLKRFCDRAKTDDRLQRLIGRTWRHVHLLYEQRGINAPACDHISTLASLCRNDFSYVPGREHASQVLASRAGRARVLASVDRRV